MPPPPEPGPRPARRLFLDDDPARAEAFLARHPDAAWVKTVDACVARLGEPWDEVHLDHDLSGLHYIPIDRDDCGMAVVRWLCREPRPHLRDARFILHSRNEPAAFAMALELHAAGYRVCLRPFGAAGPGRDPDADGDCCVEPARPGWPARMAAWARRLLGRRGEGPH